MKKIAFSIVAVLALVFGGAAAFAGDMGGQGQYTNSQDTTSGMPSMDNTTSDGSSSGSSSQPSAQSVTIQNFAFMPSSLTVPMGTTVTWTNRDTTAHTVTGDTSGGPMSGTLQPGQAYSYTFSQNGTFGYHCSIHPTMTGMVTVTPTSSSSGGMNNGGTSSGGTTTPTPPTTTPNTSSSPPSSTPSGTNTNSNSNVASANSSSTANNTIYNNTYTSTGTSKTATTPSTTTPSTTTTTPRVYTAPATTTTTPTPPSTTTVPSTTSTPSVLPNTGAAGALVAFVSTAALGTGLYYLYSRRKLSKT